MHPVTRIQRPAEKMDKGFCRGEKIHGIRTSMASEAGVSLVEILIAIIILGLTVISVSYMFGTAEADVIRLGKQRVCLPVAQQEMETLVALPYDATDLTVGRHFRRFRRPPAPPDLDLNGDLFVEWYIALINDPHGTGQDYKTIVLEFFDDLLDEDTWPQGSDPRLEIRDDVERVVTLTTLKAP